MMQFIDPSVPTADEEIRRVRTENQKKRIEPYHPSIDPKLAKLFNATIPEEEQKTHPALWIGVFSIMTRVSRASLPIG